MKLAVICFTKSGYELMKSMVDQLGDSRIESDFQIVSAYHKCRQLKNKTALPYYEKTIEEWAGEQFLHHYALLFIGSTGIAVRAIASSVENKLTDSPVLVMDDLGRFVIPLLSGHVGGANELALQLSSFTGAIPVITTATDNHQKFAIDVWAKKHRLTIMNKDAIKRVSAKVLAGESVTVEVEDACTISNPERKTNVDLMGTVPDIWLGTTPPKNEIPFDQNSSTLWLQPKEYILGIGCKKGKAEAEIREMMEEALASLHIELHQIAIIASIDAKQDEAGIVTISEKEQIPFVTFSAEELNSVPGEFHESEFVKQQMGVGSVCERAAMKTALDFDTTKEISKTRLILPKLARNGVTVAVAKKPYDIEALLTELEHFLNQ